MSSTTEKSEEVEIGEPRGRRSAWSTSILNKRKVSKLQNRTKKESEYLILMQGRVCRDEFAWMSSSMVASLRLNFKRKEEKSMGCSVKTTNIIRMKIEATSRKQKNIAWVAWFIFTWVSSKCNRKSYFMGLLLACDCIDLIKLMSCTSDIHTRSCQVIFEGNGLLIDETVQRRRWVVLIHKIKENVWACGRLSKASKAKVYREA
ncbi:hypothetical protein L2E82_31218 [Cichorium intybus]|uniref:Uncharacterized protein n=1 Tax=Cichorium intybus TaxID=13427 RepID=A0ACB9D2J3_CICIN|nr:hypothetical protein L2E82_31218 [Cichorium intybus]